MASAGGTQAQFGSLFSTYIWVGIGVFLLVTGSLAAAIVIGRRRGGPLDQSQPRDRRVRNLELGWIVLVAATVIVLVSLSFRDGDRVDALSAERPDTTIRVTAFQWGWRFDYPNGHRVIGNSERPPTLVVPDDVPVRIRLVSRDVIHAFWIPDLRFKRDAFPNRETEFELVFDPTTSGPGECAEFCGLDHARMDFRVLPLSRGGFADWLRRTAAGSSS